MTATSTSQQTRPVGSSSTPLIHGFPYVAGHLIKTMDQISNILGITVQHALDTLNSQLRAAALRSEEWKPYADNIVAVWNDKNGTIALHFRGTPEDIQAMEDLEYGSEDTPPQAIGRTTLLRYAQTQQAALSKKLTKEAGYGGN